MDQEKYAMDLAVENIRWLERQLQWIEDEINKIYPWESCPSCIADDPEDGGTHMDHFFYWASQRKS